MSASWQVVGIAEMPNTDVHTSRGLVRLGITDDNRLEPIGQGEVLVRSVLCRRQDELHGPVGLGQRRRWGEDTGRHDGFRRVGYRTREDSFRGLCAGCACRPVNGIVREEPERQRDGHDSEQQHGGWEQAGCEKRSANRMRMLY